jgi:signal transduction histidine kinase
MDRDPEIHITGSKEEKHVVFTFQDNGKGLDIALVKKQLFHLYKTFHPGVSGRGLGLYLCKILVDELKGMIDIESEENKGTLITIRFPVL